MKHLRLPLLQESFAIFFLVFVFIAVVSCNKQETFKPVSSSASSSSGLTALNRPNVILILADDIGYDALSSQGNETFQTPNIDALAAAGMRFTQCYSSPLCSPSRFMFVTGKYNFRNYTVWGEMNPNEKTFATLLRDAGYATYVAGKWQFDGGDAVIHNVGFNSYCVWDPIKADAAGPHYKNPKIYQNGNYVSSSLTKNKYGDDIFTDSVLLFINKNRTKNFFVYFPITLCHYPYSPTPDDPEFATWSTKGNPSDSSFFPSMVNYMDKKVGQIVDSLKRWGLYDNTIIMFTGDNGTPQHIFYYYNGVLTEGSKASSTTAGTHVPLIVTWGNRIAPGQINRNLVDFTDFLPTVGDAAGVSISSDYGIVDGHSFFPQLVGLPNTPRDWVFCHYQPNTNSGNTILKRWIQDTTYKLYDSTGKFYNIVLDPPEKHPLKNSEMTPQEKAIRRNFQSIMDTLHN
jgi:arylsulfatase A-like enzyme